MLKKVEITEAVSGLQPQFVKLPIRLTYVREGDTPRQWEMFEGMDTVHILINKTDSEELLLVKQVRPPVLHRYPSTDGICVEACAGMIDKYPELTSAPFARAGMIASEEILEETGYLVHPDDMELLPTYMSNVGMSGSTCYPYYCEVTDADFKGQQLEPSEDIEVIPLPYDGVKTFLKIMTNTDATTRNLLQWFLLNRI